MNPQIEGRIFALNYNLEQIHIAYKQSTRYALLDVGLEYNVKYEHNEWSRKKYQEYLTLVMTREYVLFTCILNFTQCYYMIKEYLKKLFPQYFKQVEEFFSEPEKENLARKLMSNDLKHNPDNDIQYGFRVVGRETTIYSNKVVHTTNMKHSWFYKDIETVQYCTQLYNELLQFVEQLNLDERK